MFLEIMLGTVVVELGCLIAVSYKRTITAFYTTLPTQVEVRSSDSQAQAQATADYTSLHSDMIEKYPKPANVTFVHPTHPQEDHEILWAGPQGWTHFAWRHKDHKDIDSYLSDRCFNVRRPDGSLMKDA